MTLLTNNKGWHRGLWVVAILLCAPVTVWAQSPWLQAITVLQTHLPDRSRAGWPSLVSSVAA